MKQRLTTVKNIKYLNVQPTPIGILITHLYIEAKQLGYGVY